MKRKRENDEASQTNKRARFSLTEEQRASTSPSETRPASNSEENFRISPTDITPPSMKANWDPITLDDLVQEMWKKPVSESSESGMNRSRPRSQKSSQDSVFSDKTNFIGLYPMDPEGKKCESLRSSSRSTLSCLSNKDMNLPISQDGTYEKASSVSGRSEPDAPSNSRERTPSTHDRTPSTDESTSNNHSRLDAYFMEELRPIPTPATDLHDPFNNHLEQLNTGRSWIDIQREWLECAELNDNNYEEEPQIESLLSNTIAPSNYSDGAEMWESLSNIDFPPVILREDFGTGLEEEVETIDEAADDENQLLQTPEIHPIIKGVESGSDSELSSEEGSEEDSSSSEDDQSESSSSEDDYDGEVLESGSLFVRKSERAKGGHYNAAALDSTRDSTALVNQTTEPMSVHTGGNSCDIVWESLDILKMLPPEVQPQAKFQAQVSKSGPNGYALARGRMVLDDGIFGPWLYSFELFSNVQKSQERMAALVEHHVEFPQFSARCARSRRRTKVDFLKVQFRDRRQGKMFCQVTRRKKSKEGNKKSPTVRKSNSLVARFCARIADREILIDLCRSGFTFLYCMFSIPQIKDLGGRFFTMDRHGNSKTGPAELLVVDQLGEFGKDKTDLVVAMIYIRSLEEADSPQCGWHYISCGAKEEVALTDWNIMLSRDEGLSYLTGRKPGWAVDAVLIEYEREYPLTYTPPKN